MKGISDCINKHCPASRKDEVTTKLRKSRRSTVKATRGEVQDARSEANLLAIRRKAVEDVIAELKGHKQSVLDQVAAATKSPGASVTASDNPANTRTLPGDLSSDKNKEENNGREQIVDGTVADRTSATGNNRAAEYGAKRKNTSENEGQGSLPLVNSQGTKRGEPATEVDGGNIQGVAKPGAVDKGTKGRVEVAPKLSTALPPSRQSSISELTAEQQGIVSRLTGKMLNVVSNSRAMQVLEMAVGKERAKYMVAWHGSPHDFDGFRSDKIGTGEGAQAYGYGLYFAGAKEVAEHYKNKLSGAGRSPFSPGDFPDYASIDYLIKGEGSAYKNIDDAENNRNPILVGSGYTGVVWVNVKGYPVGYRKNTDGWWSVDEGKLYQVELAPTSDEYLDWDKPLGEQSETVKKALAGLGLQQVEPPQGGIAFIVTKGKFKDTARVWNGEDLYSRVASKIGSDKAASEYLKSLGIRGIRYLDGTSRGKGEGNSNYVIFDESDIKITAKYSEDGRYMQGFALPDGTAYVIPENIERGKLWGVMLHEIGVHASLSLREGSKFKAILSSIDKRQNEQSKTGEAIRAAMARVPADTGLRTGETYDTLTAARKAEVDQLRLEETMAYLCEQAPRTGIVRRFFAILKQFLIKLGVNANILTEADFQAIAEAAIRREARGTVAESIADGVNQFAQPAMMSVKAAARKIQGLEAFKKWFGDSKVVDENGDPLVVYHGTRKDFTEFDVGENFGDLGSHFATAPGQSNAITSNRPRAKTYLSYLSIKKPLRLKDNGDFSVGSVAPQLRDMGLISEKELYDMLDITGTVEQNKAIKKAISDNGYDGVVYLNRREGLENLPDITTDFEYSSSDSEFLEKYKGATDAYIAFNKTKIKSIFNQGTWDGTNANIMKSFGGSSANTTNLDKAQKLEAQGKTPREIWNATGWWRMTKGGPWKYEIDDSLSDIRTGKDGFLDEVLKQPALFKDYPDAKDIFVRFVDTASNSDGIFHNDSKILLVNKKLPEEKQRSVVHHEVQHYIQDIEGFSSGANLNKLGPDKYWRQTGEIEARLVQARLDMPPARRKIVPPWITLKRMLRKEGLLKTGMTVDDVMMDSGKSAVMESISSQQKSYDGITTEEQNKTIAEVFGKPKTIVERAKEFSKNWQKNVIQGVFDQYAPLLELSPEAYIQARMTKGGDSTLEAILMYGKPYYDRKEGAIKVRFDKANNAMNGFAKVLSKLDGEHDLFLKWVAGQRAGNLKEVGLENLMTKDHIKSLKTLNLGTMRNGESRRAAYDEALEGLNEYNDAVLKIAVNRGLINDATRQMYQGMPYLPFYRLADEGAVNGFTASAGLVNQSAWKQLKGGTNKLNDDMLANLLQNWSHLVTASSRNEASKTALEAAVKAGVAHEVPSGFPGKGTVSFKDNTTTKLVKDASGNYHRVEKYIPAGQKYIEDGIEKISDGTAQQEVNHERTFLIDDPNLMDAISSLGKTLEVPTVLKQFKHFLTIGVTANPAFKIRNLFRDTVASMSLADMSYNPAKNIKEGFKAAKLNSESRAQLLAGGGIIRFGAMLDGANADNARELVEKSVSKDHILDDRNKITKMWKHTIKPAIDAYQEFGDRGEQINRLALYNRLIEKGMNHGEASFWARDLMDFSMSGKWAAVRFLTQTVPFFNARLQGLYKLGKSARADKKRFGYVVGGVALASLALAVAYGDDDDWKNREDWDRDNYWWFKVGGVAFRLPKPFEIGAIGTIAERGYELMADDEMTGKRFRERVGNIVTQQLSMNPTPQMIKPLIDLWANKDSFSGRPIESMGMERLKPEDRYSERTTGVAKLLGSLGLPNPSQVIMGNYEKLSPAQIDFLVKGYFSWLGTSTTTALDYGIFKPLSAGSSPSLQLRDVFLAGNFIETLPTGSSRYVTQMYEQAKEIEQAYASYHNALKYGDKERAADIMVNDGDKIRSYKQIEAIKRRESALNQRIKMIQADKIMSGDEKREKIDAANAAKQQIAKRLSGISLNKL